MRIAALADLHTRKDDEARIKRLFEGIRAEADVLLLAGDLTDHGRSGETEALLHGLSEVGIPIVAVLGNHDHEDGSAKDMMRILGSAGIHILDRRRPTTRIGDVGFAGVKGFGGGFGDHLVRGFGEEPLKAFVSASVVESEALRAGLLKLDAPQKVALLHYAPITATLGAEPPEIWPFLGSGRLEQAVDDGGADVVFHGHAHHGHAIGRTAGGAPVRNVSLPVLRAAGRPESYLLFDLPSREVADASKGVPS